MALSLRDRKKIMERVSETGHFFVSKYNKQWRLSRGMGNRPVTLVLEETPEGFLIRPPKYVFIPKTSHFDFDEEEYRCTRNKVFLFSLIRKLKDSGLWPYIENRNFFFSPNQENPRMNKYKVEKEYRKIFGGENA